MTATGDCFKVAFRLLIEHTGDEPIVLCHGLVSTDEVAPHWHAWVEIDRTFEVPVNGVENVSSMTVRHRFAVDKANGNDAELPAGAYRNMGRATGVVEYTRDEAFAAALSSEHYGPWE